MPAVPLSAQFPHGLFVAMSDNETFHYYRWKSRLGAGERAVQ
jgi:3-phytase